MNPVRAFEGDRRILGGYLDFYLRAKAASDGVVQAGISDLMARWGATEADVRSWLETAMDSGLLTRLDQTPQGSRYSVHGAPVKASSGYSEVFEEAWAAYPRRKGHSKSMAWKRWKSLMKNHRWPEAKILERVQEYAQECRLLGREDRFISHMSSFLNHDKLIDIEFETEGPEPDPTEPGVMTAEQMNRNLKGRAS